MKTKIGIIMFTLCCLACLPGLSLAHSHGGDKGGDKAGNDGFENSLSQDDLIFILGNDAWGDTSSVEATPIEDTPIEATLLTFQNPVKITLDEKIKYYQGALTATQFLHGWVGWLSRTGLSVAGGAVPVQIAIAMLDGATSSYSKNPDASPAEISSQAFEGGAVTYFGGKLGGKATKNMADSIWKEILSTATGEGFSQLYSRVKDWVPRNVQPSQRPEIRHAGPSDILRPTTLK